MSSADGDDINLLEPETESLPSLDWQTGLSELCAELDRSGVEHLGLQLPEGLRGFTADIIDDLQARLGSRVQVTLWAEPTFGACDLADRPLEELGVEALLHLGHTPMPYHDQSYRMPVHFVPVQHTGQLVVGEATIGGIRSYLERPGATRTDDEHLTLSLVTTAQHIHLLAPLKAYLEQHGLKVTIGSGSRRLAFAGQILGCNLSAAWNAGEEVDGTLYLGTGRFHPLTLALGSRLPVITLDPHTGQVGQVEAEPFLRQRHASIAKAQEAHRWALLLSPQIGQRRTKLAHRVKRQLEEAGHQVYVVAATHQHPDQLTGLEVEAAVVISCPRLAIEEGPHWPVPLLTPAEMEITLGLRTWDPLGDGYPIDEIL